MISTPAPHPKDDAAAREARLAGLAEQAAREDAPDPAPELARDPDFQRLLLRRRLSHLSLLIGGPATAGMVNELAAGASAAEASSADAFALAARAMAVAGADRAAGAPPAGDGTSAEQARMALAGARAVRRVFPFPIAPPAGRGARPRAFAMVERSAGGLWRMERRPGSPKLTLPQGSASDKPVVKSALSGGAGGRSGAGAAEAVEIDEVSLPELGRARLLWRDVRESEPSPQGSVWADPGDPATPIDPALRDQLTTRAIPLLDKLPYGAMSSRLSARRSGLAPGAPSPGVGPDPGQGNSR